MRILLLLGFILYLLILVKLVLFKGPFFYELVPASTYYKNKTANASFTDANLVPFRTIRLFLSGNTSLQATFYNIVGNMLLFLPFGLLFPLVFTRLARFGPLCLSAFALSLFFELFQRLTKTGQFDIDDILLNVGGALTGFLLFRLLRKTVPAGPEKTDHR